MKPVVDSSKCVGCGACYKVCPTQPKVMEMKEVDGARKSVIVRPEICDFGAACVRVCPTKAFKLEP